MEIGKIIRQYRDEHDLTMQQFADRTGLSKGYISMLERGRHPQSNKEIIPSIDTVQKLAAAMDMTIDSLLQICDSDQQIEIPESTARCFSAAPEQQLAADEQRVIDMYRSLDLDDRAEVRGFIKGLLAADKYKEGSSEARVI